MIVVFPDHTHLLFLCINIQQTLGPFSKVHRLHYRKLSLIDDSLSRIGQNWLRVNFMKIIGDLYQIEVCGISNNFN